jgi:hypothetical protein
MRKTTGTRRYVLENQVWVALHTACKTRNITDFVFHRKMVILLDQFVDSSLVCDTVRTYADNHKIAYGHQPGRNPSILIHRSGQFNLSACCCLLTKLDHLSRPYRRFSYWLLRSNGMFMAWINITFSLYHSVGRIGYPEFCARVGQTQVQSNCRG